MAKQSGLGDNFYIGGYNISGDVSTITTGQPSGVLEDTGIDKLAQERLLGQRSGQMEWTTYFNKASGQEHAALKTLPTTDVIATYARGATVGNQAACMVAKQVNYDGTRAADSAFTFQVQAQSNAYGLEWGQQLTAGLRTDTGATNGTSIDTVASASFGMQAYLQVTAFTGTDATIRIQDSADNSTFNTIVGLSDFTQITAAPTFQRIATTNTTTIRRYLRVTIFTTGGFSSCTYSVVAVKNEFAGYVT